ncbi:3D domain-containing protein [Deinococcus sp. KNUC1210]|uniref:3D domain-containing protein n=1 Tax=Deinococcus sp. KNUC1210 TaxID=2917691 RepID=UPI001EF01287|nr:3D domain-containing protein [Deinococcus sp. KNUC1210]ULH16081.1 3D domain-containing protein [Deinococcus sp. KNUC1210]
MSFNRLNRCGTARLLALSLATVGLALATPALPSSALASRAVSTALAPAAAPKAVAPKTAVVTPKKATPAPVRAAKVPVQVKTPVQAKVPTPKVAAPSAAALRAQGVRQAQAVAATVPRANGRSAVVHATAYSSTPGQTDSTPFVTATGTRVRPGVVALSPDLLRRFPYGTRLMIEDLSGGYSAYLKGKVFVVEDTMNPRIYNTLDIWMGTSYQAMNWGARNIRITALN